MTEFHGRLALLYSPNITNSFVTSFLEKKYGRMYKIAEKQSFFGVLGRTLKRKRDPLLSKLDKVLFYAYYFLFLKNQVNSVLSSSLGNPETPVPDLEVDNINDTKAITALKGFEPDLILVSATGILGQKWLHMDVPIINVHTGIVPRYRGKFCWFWPVVEENHEMLGVSVHLVKTKVDSGQLISQQYINSDEINCYTIENILTRIAPLICVCLEEAIDILAATKPAIPLPPNNALFHAYLEPGLTDYIEFIKNSRSPA